MTVGVMVGGAVLGLAGSASAVTLPGDDWYGYAVTGATYTSTTADWTMPALTCGSSDDYLTIWTGLDGYSSDTVEQIGGLIECVGSTPEYYGWYELYPSSAVYFSKTVKAGDKLDSSVTYASSKFTLTLRDVTQDWTQTVTASVAGAARSSAETVVEPSDNFSCPKALTLAAFTGDTVDGTALGKLHPIEGTGSDPDITVTSVSGESFSVLCR